MTILAEEWQVLSFFEVEPTVLDEDVPWPYNNYLFEIEKDDVSLSCALEPACQDVRLIVKRGDIRLYELNAVGVKDVRYWEQGAIELLEIVLSEGHVVRLRVKPNFEISHESSSET